MARSRLNSETNLRLLEEGVSAFLARGYHGTGIKEVLDRVNVPKGSFYNYFKSKEEFGAAVIRHYSSCLGKKMGDVLGPTPDSLTGLRVFFAQLMAEFEAADYMGGCLVANLGGELEGSEVCRQALSEAFAAWQGGMRDALAKAQQQDTIRKDIDPGELADLLIHAWEGAVIRMKIERSLAPLHQCLRHLLDDYFKPR
ncbi:MAG: TetR family transcriptional regulator C-terminal domain-containing protein [Planctomycetes bacterium]|nr:TetR family transcriptional regulator C-terminal domain-containing protein [Planctomycetota bacterium]